MSRPFTDAETLLRVARLTPRLADLAALSRWFISIAVAYNLTGLPADAQRSWWWLHVSLNLSFVVAGVWLIVAITRLVNVWRYLRGETR